MVPSTPPPPRGPRNWARQWIEDERVFLSVTAPEERAFGAARLSAMLSACAEDEAGLEVLVSTRRELSRVGDSEGLARIEIAFAEGAVARDDSQTAALHLAAARKLMSARRSTAARAWIVESRLARLEGGPAPPGCDDDPAEAEADLTSSHERMDLAAELCLERAVVARLASDLIGARLFSARATASARRTGSRRLVAEVEIETALAAAQHADPKEAYARIVRAIQELGEAGLTRDEGRAMIRLAEMVATEDTGTSSESPLVWLGRAKATLGTAATWRDRLAFRTGFRTHGRRLVDRLMSDETASRILGYEKARGELLGFVSMSSEMADSALTTLEMRSDGGPTGDEEAEQGVSRARAATYGISRGVGKQLAEVDRVVSDLIDLVGAAIVERDRLEQLVTALSSIDTAASREVLPSLIAQVTAGVLDADHVVVALAAQGELIAAARFGTPAPGEQDAWKAVAAAAADSRTGRNPPLPTVRRSATAGAESHLFAPLRATDLDGILYVDKRLGGGQFRDQDHALLRLLAEYSAVALGRLTAHEQRHSALRRLAVTLDAIRDGVVSWDRDGVIFSTNTAIERMLHLRKEELVGARMSDVPALAALSAAVSSSPRLDGAVVKMPSGNFVVSTRPLGGRDDASAGVVATLVEVDRVQKIAQRLGTVKPRYGFHDMIGVSSALGFALAIARQASTVSSTVLITGESGTGKEVVAQAIHTSSERAGEPFVGLNVAALPRELLEAELFGYERGAFTGARSDGNLGKFELAGSGTILLDEIGEMPLDMQAKLLRVLQERVVVRLGGSVERPVHARVMATTHRDLTQLVDEGRFRLDLLYRLRVLSIELPPLRERPEDITALAEHYLFKFAEQQRKRVAELSPKVQQELTRYEWPGNIRELANVIESEVSLLPADTTVLARLATRLIGRFRAPGPASTGEFRAVESLPFGPLSPVIPLAELEKKAFLHALDRNKQSIARAAEALGVSKVTFYAKLRSWGMHPKDRPDDESPLSSTGQWTAISAPDSYPADPRQSVPGQSVGRQSVSRQSVGRQSVPKLPKK